MGFFKKKKKEEGYAENHGTYMYKSFSVVILPSARGQDFKQAQVNQLYIF